MKKYIYLILCLLAHVSLFAQMEDFVCFHTEEEDTSLNLRAGTSSFSGNGRYFTPQGDLRALIVCAGFGSQYDNSFSVGNWDAAPGALPAYLLNKSTVYSDTTDFFTYANVNHNKNLSRFYYEMSHHKFRFMADVYPERITIDATGAGNFATLNQRVIEKMKQEDPNFDWSPYDLRKNNPNFYEDANGYIPDGKPDFVIVLYRYSTTMPNQPVAGMAGWQGSTGGYDTFNGISSNFNYNGYTFGGSGFTAGACIYSLYRLFIHEVAHGMFYCPHYSGANDVVGNYFYGNTGWGMMSLDLISFPCALGWEKWYLNWIDGIRANGVDADIKSASDLNTSGEYTLRDFLTTGDVVRIKIPNTSGGRNQYLWLENHQGISIFDKRGTLNDGCGNPLPSSPQGIAAYIESINDNRTAPHTSIEPGANGIKYLHPGGNFDYVFDAPHSNPCGTWGVDVYNLKETGINPMGGQSRLGRIRQDFDFNNVISVGTGTNSAGVKNESASVVLRDSVFTYDGWNTEITFSQGSRLSMSSNPCPVNVPTYDMNTKKLTAFILNGISVKVQSYTNGNAKIKIAYNDVAIDNDIRYTGLIHLPDITQNANPDIIIQSGITLSIDKSGTPNRHTKTAADDFINPTEFHCLENSFFKQEENSIVEVKRGSTLIISGKYEINKNAKLKIKSGSYLQIKQNANLQIKNYGEIIIENGGYICVESGASINLQDYSGIIFLREGAILGANPALFTGQCLSMIPFSGSGTVVDGSSDVYIQNETITANRYIGGKNIHLGHHVTTSKAQGNVIITNNANVIFEASENVVFDAGFECAEGATFEVR